MDKPYNSLDRYLRERFGKKLYKLSLSSAATCPNRDGRVGVGGCIFCGESGSGDFACGAEIDIYEQLVSARELVGKKLKNSEHGYIAYFQSFTGTYAPTKYLRELFNSAIDYPGVEVLSVATRPDCLPEEILELLSQLREKKPVWVELGLQSSSETTAEMINRCCPNESYVTAVKELKRRGIEVIIHVILGLPGETVNDMLATIDFVNELGADGIKLQLLHVLRGTRLADTDYTPMTLEEYACALFACIERLSPDTVIHRITGDGAKRNLIAPEWSANKKAVLNYLHGEMKKREVVQGKNYRRSEQV